ncbi:MAG: helix-turn-helix transcriptional regulator [Chloroflexota bacterium]|nr:helix-turn-helix transcriptional regulator [Chloroflexota bacterium]
MDSNGLGGLIRRRREELKLTQEELARRIGSTRASASQIEGGTRKWPRRYVSALSDALDLSEQEMEDGAGRIRPLGGGPRGAGSTRLTRDNSELRLRVSNGPTDTQVALAYIDGLIEALGDRLDDRGRAALRVLLEALAEPVALRGLEAEADAEKAEAVP